MVVLSKIYIIIAMQILCNGILVVQKGQKTGETKPHEMRAHGFDFAQKYSIWQVWMRMSSIWRYKGTLCFCFFFHRKMLFRLKIIIIIIIRFQGCFDWTQISFVSSISFALANVSYIAIDGMNVESIFEIDEGKNMFKKREYSNPWKRNALNQYDFTSAFENSMTYKNFICK